MYHFALVPTTPAKGSAYVVCGDRCRLDTVETGKDASSEPCKATSFLSFRDAQVPMARDSFLFGLAYRSFLVLPSGSPVACAWCRKIAVELRRCLALLQKPLDSEMFRIGFGVRAYVYFLRISALV